MSKSRLSEEGNPISSRIDDVVVSPPSPQAKWRSSINTNPSNISSRKHVVDDQMMEYFLGVDYTMDETREQANVLSFNWIQVGDTSDLTIIGV